MMIPAIIGARIYYVVFSWDSYKDNIPEIFNLRHGGLGIVGGVAMAVLVLFLFAKAKKQSVLLMLDTMTMGLLIGQIMGRWGNFFNREAFGGYTDGPLAMQIPLKYFEQYGGYQNLRVQESLSILLPLLFMGRSCLIFRYILHFFMKECGIFFCCFLSLFIGNIRSLMENFYVFI